MTSFKSLSTTVSTAAILRCRLASLASTVTMVLCCPVFQGRFETKGSYTSYSNIMSCNYPLTRTSLILAWVCQQCSNAHHVRMADTALLRKGNRPMNAPCVLRGNTPILVRSLKKASYIRTYISFNYIEGAISTSQCTRCPAGKFADEQGSRTCLCITSDSCNLEFKSPAGVVEEVFYSNNIDFYRETIPFFGRW